MKQNENKNEAKLIKVKQGEAKLNKMKQDEAK
jgi:hypothetical protein